MPTYSFRCRKCGRVTQVAHGFDAPHPEHCEKPVITKVRLGRRVIKEGVTPEGLRYQITDKIPDETEPCGGELERIFDSPNVIYIGGGFYTTERRVTPVNPLDYNPDED